jgi:pimeloyl-ACP methyl ester carboxylesterase
MLASVITLAAMTLAIPDNGSHGFRPTRYVDVQGVKVAVYESEGCGTDILFVHGNTSMAQSYEKVFESHLAREYHFVALDLPGYGNSENAPAYNIDLFTSAIAEVARATGADDGVLVGWSLGGDLSFQTRRRLPDLKGIFVFGTAPVGRDPTLPPAFLSPTQSYAGEAVTYGTMANLTVQQVHDYVTAFFRPHYHGIPDFFYRYGVRTDPGTRAAVLNAATFSDPGFHDEVVITRSFDIPLAIVLADHDAFLNPDFLFALAPSLPTLWRDAIQVVHNSGHATQWEHPAELLRLVDEFVRDVD